MTDTTDVAVTDVDEAPAEDAPDAPDARGDDAPDDSRGAHRERADTDSGEDEVAHDEPGREAAKWRRKLRETEAERDALQAVVAHLRRAELDRIATSGPNGAPRLHDAADLFGDDFDLSALVDDDGRVDETRVREHIAERTADRPYLRADLGPRPPASTRGQGMSAAGAGPRDTGEAWVDLLRGGRR